MPLSRFPTYRQLDSMDCGSTCLRIVSKYYGKFYSAATMRERCITTREGVSLLGISDAAESIGFRTISVKLTFRQLRRGGDWASGVCAAEQLSLSALRYAARRGAQHLRYP